MTESKLPDLFHDLTSAIASISTLSQICVFYVNHFGIDKLTQNIKDNILEAYANIDDCKKRAEELALLASTALAKTGCDDERQAFQSEMAAGTRGIKEIFSASGHPKEVFTHNGAGEKITHFCDGLERVRTVCGSMISSIDCCKSALKNKGKYK